MENLKTQLVVIAGGPSGMSAAVQAAMDGAEVIVIEKANVTGGAANMGMGPLGIGTRYQQEQMIGVTVEKVNTANFDGKLKRQGRTQGRTPSYKKAIVKLTESSKTIEFFEGM